MPTSRNHYFSLGLQLLIKTLHLLKPRYENQKHSSLDSWMCTEHSMLRRNSNMELIQTSILQPIWSTAKECVQKQIFN